MKLPTKFWFCAREKDYKQWIRLWLPPHLRQQDPCRFPPSWNFHLVALTKLFLNKNSSDSVVQPYNSFFDTLYTVSLSGLFCWVNSGIEELDWGLVEKALIWLMKVTTRDNKRILNGHSFLHALGWCVAPNLDVCTVIYMWTWFKNMG